MNSIVLHVAVRAISMSAARVNEYCLFAPSNPDFGILEFQACGKKNYFRGLINEHKES
jgi:hypothetical protein